MRAMTTALALAGLVLAMGALAAPARAAGACEDLASLRLPHVSITSVQVVGATPALPPPRRRCRRPAG